MRLGKPGGAALLVRSEREFRGLPAGSVGWVTGLAVPNLINAGVLIALPESEVEPE